MQNSFVWMFFSAENWHHKAPYRMQLLGTEHVEDCPEWLEQLWKEDIHEPQLAHFLSGEDAVSHSECRTWGLHGSGSGNAAD